MQDKKIAGGTVYQILTKTFTSACGFIITIILARYFEPRIYGEFTKVTVFVGLFYLIADFGLNAVFLKLEEKKADFHKLLTLRLLLSFCIIIIVNLLVFSLPFNIRLEIGFPPHLRLSVFIFSFTILFQAVLITSSAIFQKKLKFDFLMYSVVSGTFLALILIIIFSNLQMPLEYILIAYLIGNALSAVISLFFVNEKKLKLKIDPKFNLKLLKDSLPLGLMLFFNLIYFRVDILILSFYNSASDIGLYGYAYKYFEFLLAIPLFISNAVYPFLLESLKNLRRFYAISNKYIIIFILISILIIVPAWILTPLIAYVKNEFAPSILILRILILSLPIFFITSILQWILIARDKKIYLLKTYSLAALLNIILNLIFIPQYGYISAAIITGFSEAVIMVLLIFKYNKLKLQDRVVLEKFTNLRKNYDKQV